ncbi:hypothetical protein [Chryseolinea lacunae]|uniref:Lipoprotein n=1 Tax=Chryseolinea lacunae TaxID=2801331 RepID=A0ABS1KWS4_9BACT|nr:hypothetical protein [Chryseolinea lacunae]MBL0743780.1 hypothetical protein [Chryseolinea lacunae]
MKTSNLFGKIASVALMGTFAFVISCKDEDKLTLADTQDITEEAITDSYYQDMDDLAGVAVSAPTDDQYSKNGRVETTYSVTVQDDRFDCDGVVVSVTPDANSTLEAPKGVLIVNFGTTGCADGRGNTRTGKVIFTYNGRRFQPGSTVVTTVENYTINGVKLEGVRTLTNVSGSTAEAPKFNAKLVGGKATFIADGTVAERESNITWQWIREANPLNDYLLIDQASTASGTTRGGRTYSVSLSKALKYKRFCGIAVEGIKKYLIDGSKEITIDYGDGTCDKSVVITVNGVTRNINVN